MAIENNIAVVEKAVMAYPKIGRRSIKDILSQTNKTPPKLDIQGIGYHREKALDGISLDIPRGSKFGILGHNGSGKSTLLALLLGIIKPNEGIVRVNGRAVGLLEMGSGFHPELSGEENILLHLSVLGVRLSESKALLPSVIDFCELGAAISYPLKTYSSGMVTRLAFSVLCHIPADIFLVDEVIAVGDYSFQKKCMDFMQRFSKKGGTIVYVAQDPNTLKEFCDLGICLHEGRVTVSGNMEKVAQTFIQNIENIKANA